MRKIPRSVVSVPWDNRRPIVFRWSVSSYSGWGVNGMNLAIALARDPASILFSAVRFSLRDVVVDPLRHGLIAPLASRSAGLWDALDAGVGAAMVDAPILLALGEGIRSSADEPFEPVTGRPTIGVVFLEHATVDADARARGNRLAVIIAGSSWNTRMLREQGVDRVATVLQGVDTSLFHPAPRAGLYPGRFIVFSGGKLEYRKGQDLVLAAFRAFRQRHAEAMLVTAWHSHWSDLSATPAAVPGLSQPRLGASGTPDVVGWAVANGIPADSIVDIGLTPNIAMPHVLREADVGLFPNRCEGGTNLVAMECMACGVPTILSANTGHQDLLAHDGGALPLRRQTEAVRDGIDTVGWGESDVEEIVETLELVWRDRERAAATGLRGAQQMARQTWRAQTDRLLDAIAPYRD